MSNIVFELFAKLGLDSSEYEQGLQDAKSEAFSISGAITGGLKTIGKAGVAIGSAVGVAAAAVTTTLVKGAGDIAAYGDNIDKMSQKMGISAQAYQEWDAIMQHSGTSIEALKPSMKTLANAAEKGSDAFQKLGISQKEVASLSQEDLFAKVITGLQGMKEGTERTYLTSQLLGKGATELGALLNTSAEDTEKMRKTVHELGGVMSDDAVKAAAAYQDSLQDMQTSFAGLKRNLLSDFMPSITNVMDGLTAIFSGDYTSGLNKISEGVNTVVANITQELPKVIELGTSIVETLITAIVDNLPAIVDASVQIVITLIDGFIGALPKLAEGALTLITSLGEALFNNAGKLLESGKELLNFVINGIKTNLPSLLESGAEVLLSIVNGFLESFPDMLEAIGDLVNDMLDYFLEHLPEFLEMGINLLLNIVDGIVNNLPKIIETAITIILKLQETIIKNLPKILQTGIELLGKLITGIIKAIPQLVAALPKVIKSIVSAFSQFNWAEIGTNLLTGIKNGILNAVGEVIEAAKEAASAIWDSITSFFDIHSPSKKMVWIGKMVDEGLAQGIEKNTDVIDDAIDDLDVTPTINYATAGAGETTNSPSENHVIINVYGAIGQDVNELADIISRRINDVTDRQMMAMGATL